MTTVADGETDWLKSLLIVRVMAKELWRLHKDGEHYAARLRVDGDSVVLELRREDYVVFTYRYDAESPALKDADAYRTALEIVGWSEEK